MDDSIVDTTILTKNVQKIYKTIQNLSDTLEIKKTEKILTSKTAEAFQSETENQEHKTKININENEYTEIKNGTDIDDDHVLSEYISKINEDNSKTTPQIAYNEELLNCAGIVQVKSEFLKRLLASGAITILIITIFSVTMLYTLFKITYSKRIKELGMLTAIGMNNKQINKMLRKEVLILGTIGIVIGLLIGLIVSIILIKLINILVQNYILDLSADILNKIIVTRVEFCIKVNNLLLIFTIILTYIITFISSKLSIRKMDKINPIDAITGTINKKQNKKKIKSSEIIEKLFGIVGMIAYKNIQIDKTQYKTIVISLIMGIILFLCVNGIIIDYHENRRPVSAFLRYNRCRVYI